MTTMLVVREVTREKVTEEIRRLVVLAASAARSEVVHHTARINKLLGDARRAGFVLTAVAILPDESDLVAHIADPARRTEILMQTLGYSGLFPPSPS